MNNHAERDWAEILDDFGEGIAKRCAADDSDVMDKLPRFQGD